MLLCVRITVFKYFGNSEKNCFANPALFSRDLFDRKTFLTFQQRTNYKANSKPRLRTKATPGFKMVIASVPETPWESLYHQETDTLRKLQLRVCVYFCCFKLLPKKVICNQICCIHIVQLITYNIRYHELQHGLIKRMQHKIARHNNEHPEAA